MDHRSFLDCFGFVPHNEDLDAFNAASEGSSWLKVPMHQATDVEAYVQEFVAGREHQHPPPSQPDIATTAEAGLVRSVDDKPCDHLIKELLVPHQPHGEPAQVSSSSRRAPAIMDTHTDPEEETMYRTDQRRHRNRPRRSGHHAPDTPCHEHSLKGCSSRFSRSGCWMKHDIAFFEREWQQCKRLHPNAAAQAEAGTEPLATHLPPAHQFKPCGRWALENSCRFTDCKFSHRATAVLWQSQVMQQKHCRTLETELERTPSSRDAVHAEFLDQDRRMLNSMGFESARQAGDRFRNFWSGISNDKYQRRIFMIHDDPQVEKERNLRPEPEEPAITTTGQVARALAKAKPNTSEVVHLVWIGPSSDGTASRFQHYQGRDVPAPGGYHFDLPRGYRLG